MVAGILFGGPIKMTQLRINLTVMFLPAFKSFETEVTVQECFLVLQPWLMGADSSVVVEVLKEQLFFFVYI